MLPGFSLAGGAGGLGLNGGNAGDIKTSYGGAGIAGDFIFQRKAKALDQLPLYAFLTVTILVGTWFVMKRV